MYRITTALDGTKTATCQHCGEARGFRSEKLLSQWKAAHAKDCGGAT